MRRGLGRQEGQILVMSALVMAFLFVPLSVFVIDTALVESGYAQLGETLRRPVVRVAFIERALGRLDDVHRSRKVRLTDFQVDDILALALQLARAEQHFIGGFHANAAHSIS